MMNVFEDRSGRMTSHWSPEMLLALITTVTNNAPSTEKDLDRLVHLTASAFAALPPSRTNVIDRSRLRAKILNVPRVNKLSSSAVLKSGRAVVDFARLPDHVLSVPEQTACDEQR
jgi:hypothetical protein